MIGLIDMHCHVLPFVDDGASNLKEAVAMLELQYDSGVRAVIVTPHYRKEMFETPTSVLKESFKRLRAAMKKNEKRVQLYLGCEFHARRHVVEILDNKGKPTMAGTKYVLIEFSSRDEFRKIQNTIYDMVQGGYKPIIAHAERYPCLTKEIDNIIHLRNLGAQIQVNAGSILGESGYKIKKFTKQLMQQDLLDYVGSDAHGLKERAPNLGACATYVEKKMGYEYAARIFIVHPRKILEARAALIGIKLSEEKLTSVG